jgi:hypothetical protein
MLPSQVIARQYYGDFNAKHDNMGVECVGGVTAISRDRWLRQPAMCSTLETEYGVI